LNLIQVQSAVLKTEVTTLVVWKITQALLEPFQKLKGLVAKMEFILTQKYQETTAAFVIVFKIKMDSSTGCPLCNIQELGQKPKTFSRKLSSNTTLIHQPSMTSHCTAE
jgi:hypothetical protein